VAPVIDRDEVEWLTAAEVAEQVGPDITPDLLYDWKRRGLIRATTIGAGRTRTAHYHRNDVINTELATRLRPAGRPRRGA